LPPKSIFSRCLILAIALASNIGGQASPISSPQNLIALGSMDPPLSWLQWFAIALPVASVSILAIWAFLQIMYSWEEDLRIPKMRKNTDPLTRTHYYVLFITVLTIVLWCTEKSFEGWIGDMGVIAIFPIIAFFGTGILSKVGVDPNKKGTKKPFEFADRIANSVGGLPPLPLEYRFPRHGWNRSGQGCAVIWSVG
jgi:phosphate transporter